MRAAAFSRKAVASGPTVTRPLRSMTGIPSRSRCWISRAIGMSDRQLHADHDLHFFDGYHLDRIPGAAVEESSVGALADALLASDAQFRIDFDVPERRVILVRDPIHTVGNRAIRHAGRRSGTPGTALRDDGKFLGPLFARGGKKRPKE